MTASIDGGDFVAGFLRLTAANRPAFLDYVVECSATMAAGSWTEADPAVSTISVDADQSGVPEGYERVEFRIDMSAQDCSFVRVRVD